MKHYINEYIKTIQEMKTFLLLWVTQSFSGLGSAMTSYALVIWSYSQKRKTAYNITGSNFYH